MAKSIQGMPLDIAECSIWRTGAPRIIDMAGVACGSTSFDHQRNDGLCQSGTRLIAGGDDGTQQKKAPA